MKRQSLAALAAVVGLVAAGCGGSGSGSGSSSAGAAPATGGGSTPTVGIMVGGLNKQIYLPVMLAQQLGFYAKHGVTVELTDEPAGVDAESAMLAGQVDGVVGFYDHTIDLQGKGKSAQSVVQLLQLPGEVELCRVDLQGQIRSPADWAGKKLGVTGLGSSTNFLTKALAERAGLAVADTTSIPVQAGATFIAAMQHKAIDCGMTTEPTVSALLGRGQAYVLVDMRSLQGTQKALGGLYPASCLYMQTSYVTSHRATVQRLVDAFVDTLHWIHGHTAAEIADKMPPEYYKGIGKAAYVKALEGEKDIFTTDGVMPAAGPDMVLKVLQGFNPQLAGKHIDLAQTYSTEFAKAASVGSGS